MRPTGPRDPLAGPDAGPQAPFPIRIDGKVVAGFGRGSKELGIPTANIPIEGLSVGGHEDLESGVYYGWAGLSPDHKSSSDTTSTSAQQEQAQGNGQESGTVYPMVMSIGWNPFYKNSVRSVEVHIMHEFAHDFYGSHMNLVILGYIRPEYDYTTVESLIEDIRTDIQVSKDSLARPAYTQFREDAYLLSFQDRSDTSGKAFVVS